MNGENVTTTDQAKPLKPAKKKIRRGGLNLVILGVLSVMIAMITTGVALAIYHNSGDIYLDRSRPGYLPDETEIKDESEKQLEYELSKSGKIDMKVLEEYLDNLEQELTAVDAYEKPFGPEVLSDGQLGIPAE